jgi:hypothetical protein
LSFPQPFGENSCGKLGKKRKKIAGKPKLSYCTACGKLFEKAERGSVSTKKDRRNFFGFYGLSENNSMLKNA